MLKYDLKKGSMVSTVHCPAGNSQNRSVGTKPILGTVAINDGRTKGIKPKKSTKELTIQILQKKKLEMIFFL